jgi:hypothetical protein
MNIRLNGGLTGSKRNWNGKPRVRVDTRPQSINSQQFFLDMTDSLSSV